jgi:hypothetical protein
LGLVGLDGLGWARWVGVDWDRLGNVSLDRWGWVRLGELVGLDGLVGFG